MEAAAKLKRKKLNRFFGTKPKKKQATGRVLSLMSQTPRTGAGDSAAEVDVIDAQLCICQGHLSMCGTFLVRLLSPPDIPLLLPTPKENYALNLSKVTSGIWSFRIVTAILGTKNWYNFGSLPCPWCGGFTQTNKRTNSSPKLVVTVDFLS